MGHDAGSASAGGSDLPPVDCGVVVVTYNSAADICGLLDSIGPAMRPLHASALAGRPPSWRVVVVDNDSTDHTVPLVAARGDAIVVRAGANLGYAGGINLGRRCAGPRASTLILNPDLRLAPGAAALLIAELADPTVGVAAPLLQDPDGTTLRSLRRDPTPLRALGEALLGDHLPWRPAWASELVRTPAAYAVAGDADWVTGAAMLISEACDRAVGDWDERFFLYSEEVDFAVRCRRAGYRVRFCPQARAMHREGGSGQSSDLVALMALSRVRCYQKLHGGAGAARYRAANLLHELLRCRDNGHRAALRCLIRLAPPPSLAALVPAADAGQ
ncbi:MAG: glycosyltransferase [Acidimicrobiales bacterium]